MVKKQKKRYDTPEKGWEGGRIKEEKELISEFGLKNKKEVWKAQSFIRNMRREARKLIASENKDKRENIIGKLNSLGLVKEKAELDDVLSLDVIDILKRRLQTLVYKKGIANTMKEARQEITHGRIKVDGKKVDVPSYLVRKEEENKIEIKETGGEGDE